MSYTIEQAKEILERAGVDFSPTRFPYTYNHDWLRDFAANTFGVALSRAEVAESTKDMADQQGDNYTQWVIAGALIYLLYWNSGVCKAIANDPDTKALFYWAINAFGKDCEKAT